MEHLQLKNFAFCIGLYLLPYIFHLCFPRFFGLPKTTAASRWRRQKKGKLGLKPGGCAPQGLGVDGGLQDEPFEHPGSNSFGLFSCGRGWKADPHVFLLGIMIIEISWIITLSVYIDIWYIGIIMNHFFKNLYTPNRIMECQKGLWTLLRWIIWFRICPWWKTHCVFV